MKKVLYSAVVLDDASHNLLVDKFGEEIGDWKLFAHHMTIGFQKSLEDLDLSRFEGKMVTLNVTHLGKSDKAIAVKVSGFKTLNKIPHITLGVSTIGSPVDSNKITDWSMVEDVINVSGVVKNLYN